MYINTIYDLKYWLYARRQKKWVHHNSEFSLLIPFSFFLSPHKWPWIKVRCIILIYWLFRSIIWSFCWFFVYLSWSRCQIKDRWSVDNEFDLTFAIISNLPILLPNLNCILIGLETKSLRRCGQILLFRLTGLVKTIPPQFDDIQSKVI